MVALILGDYFAGIFDHNLIGFKSTIGSYAVTSISRLHHFHTNVVFSPLFASFFQVSKGAVCAMLRTNVAIVVITFVEHETIKAIFITTILLLTNAQRVLH